ncbi:MAG: glycosyltransferase [Dolichospermum sp. DEX182a]|nr:glycosyltransferase [Dolichospermum sp. DEX182a]
MKSNQKNITFFTTDLYRGGVAEVVYKLVSVLSNYEQFKISVIVYDNISDNFKLPSIVEVHQLRMPLWANFGKNKFDKFVRAILRYILLPFAIAKYILLKDKLNSDIIISNTPVINLIALLFKGEEKIIIVDHVVVDQDAQNNQIIKHFLATLSKLIYQKADRAVAISKPLAKYYEEKIGILNNKIVNIPNFIDIKKINTLASEMIGSESDYLYNIPVIVSVGRLSQQKGQWHLIRAFKKVIEVLKEANLLLVGDGELKNSLLQLSKDIGIEKNVCFVGWQTNPIKYMFKADIFVFPSLWEGFGLSLVEAMACGLPVISTDCQAGPRDILAPYTNLELEISDLEYTPYGVLVPVPDGIWRDAEEPLTSQENLLAEAIIQLLKNKEEYDKYSQASICRSADFSVDRIVPQWVSLLEEL